jgi:hypothetical protein
MPRLFAVFMLLAANLGLIPPPASAADPAVYETYAVRYATLKGYPVSSLVQGADEDRKLDIAMMVWVLKGPAKSSWLMPDSTDRNTWKNGNPSRFSRGRTRPSVS